MNTYVVDELEFQAHYMNVHEGTLFLYQKDEKDPDITLIVASFKHWSVAYSVDAVS